MTEFSRPLPLADLNRSPARMKIKADPAEFPALAERLGVPAVISLDAFLTIRRTDSRLRVEGTFQTAIEQICVVSLEQFRNTADGQIEEEFLLTDDPDSPEVDLDADEIMIEPFSGDQIDLGEIVVQNLLLVLDPHPRAQGAALSDLDYDPAQLGVAGNPFAALGKLKLNR